MGEKKGYLIKIYDRALYNAQLSLEYEPIDYKYLVKQYSTRWLKFDRDSVLIDFYDKEEAEQAIKELKAKYTGLNIVRLGGHYDED